MSGLRVAVVTGNYHGVVDGVAMTLHRYVPALLAAGAAVRVYAPYVSQPAFVTYPGDLFTVPSVSFVGPYRLALGFGPAKADLIRFRPNLIYISTPDLLGLAALHFARRRNIPAVATFFTHYGTYLRHYGVGFLARPYWFGVRQFYRRCKSVYVTGPSLIDDLRRENVRANFVQMPLGVDTERFHPGRRNDDWRRARGFGPHECVILYVGRLVWEKGLETFAETVRLLGARGVPHRVLVVGEGPAGATFRKMLPRATFAGRLTGGALPRAMASSDVFFFPSASETFGLVSLEALASGLACVVADATGSKDIIRHGTDGVVCPVDDVPKFADALESLIRDPALRARYAAAGVTRARAFAWPDVLERTVRAMHIDAGLA
jgi:glycosyltransferase involved in cell wall biosynthesis